MLRTEATFVSKITSSDNHMKLYLHTWTTFAPARAMYFHAQVFLCSKEQGQNERPGCGSFERKCPNTVCID